MLNKIMLIGNLGKDPELQVTAEGTPIHAGFHLRSIVVTKPIAEKRKRKPNGSTLSLGGSLQKYVSDTCIKAQKSISKADSRSASIPIERVCSVRQ